MKYLLNILFVFLFSVVLLNTTFSSSGDLIDQTKTIGELKSEIKEIDKQKEKSLEKLDELQKELLVRKFFKINLSKNNKEKLDKLILEYNNKKRNLNRDILIKSKNLEDIKNIKKQLLENEKNFYGNLIEYIDLNKYQDYIKYIKERLIILNKKLDLDNSSKIKETIIKNKVENIKERIKENNKIINTNTINIINNKINSLLKKIINSEKYKKLNNDGKLKLFDALIRKISFKINKLEERENKSKTLKIIINNKDDIIKNIKNFRNKNLKSFN